MKRKSKLNQNKNYKKKVTALDLKYLIVNNMKFIGEVKTTFNIRPKGNFDRQIRIDILSTFDDEKYLDRTKYDLLIFTTSWIRLYKSYSKYYKDYTEGCKINRAFKIPIFIYTKEKMDDTSIPVDNPEKTKTGFATKKGDITIQVHCEERYISKVN